MRQGEHDVIYNKGEHDVICGKGEPDVIYSKVIPKRNRQEMVFLQGHFVEGNLKVHRGRTRSLKRVRYSCEYTLKKTA